MTEVTMILMEDLEKNTVDWVPNYDDTRTEPVVLPSKFPQICFAMDVPVLPLAWPPASHPTTLMKFVTVC